MLLAPKRPACSPALRTAIVSKYLLLAVEVMEIILRLLRSSMIHLGRLPSSPGMLRAPFLGLRASLTCRSLRVLLMAQAEQQPRQSLPVAVRPLLPLLTTREV